MSLFRSLSKMITPSLNSCCLVIITVNGNLPLHIDMIVCVSTPLGHGTLGGVIILALLWLTATCIKPFSMKNSHK